MLINLLLVVVATALCFYALHELTPGAWATAVGALRRLRTAPPTPPATPLEPPHTPGQPARVDGWEASAEPERLSATVASRQLWWPAVLLLSLTILAVVIRWWALGAYENRVWGDEATITIEARRFLTGERSDPFVNDTLNNPILFEYLLAPIFRVTGVSVTIARAYTSVWGALGVPLLYGLARELGLRRSIAFAAAALLATASWHVHISRMAVINVAGATMVEAVLYCVVGAIRWRSFRWAGVTGVVLALAMNNYTGARLIFPILGVWLAYMLAFHGRWGRTGARGRTLPDHPLGPSSPLEMTDALPRVGAAQLAALGGVAAAVALVLLIPLIRYYLSSPQDFTGHTTAMFALSQDQIHRTLALHPQLRQDVWGVLQYQFEHTVGMFTTSGPMDTVTNLPGRPLLDGISSVFLPIGLLVCLWNWKRPWAALLLAWALLAFLFGAFLTIDPPNGHRPIPIAPALALIVALGIEVVLALLLRLWRVPARRPAGQYARATWGDGRAAYGLSRGALLALVVLIGVVNIRREIAYESSDIYITSLTNPATLWSKILGPMGAVSVSVDAPLSYPGELPLLFAPQAMLCNSHWFTQWQRCPPARVIIFDPASGADATRYAALTHHHIAAGPAPYGQILYWYAIAPPGISLPDLATTLGHAG